MPRPGSNSGLSSSGMSETAPSQGSENNLDIGAQANDIIATVRKERAAQAQKAEMERQLREQNAKEAALRLKAAQQEVHDLRNRLAKTESKTQFEAKKGSGSSFTASPTKETTQQITEKLKLKGEDHEMEQEAHNKTKNELKRMEIDLLATKKELVTTKKMADLKEKIGVSVEATDGARWG
jgi:hypothetical protein